MRKILPRASQSKTRPHRRHAGSVREVISRGDKSFAGIAARRAARSTAALSSPKIFTTIPKTSLASFCSFRRRKRLSSHRPKPTKCLLPCASPTNPARSSPLLNPSPPRRQPSKNRKPPHPRAPFEYQFYLDVETNSPAALNAALAEVRSSPLFPRPRPLSLRFPRLKSAQRRKLASVTNTACCELSSLRTARDSNSRGSMHVGHIVVHGENILEVGFVRKNMDHPAEHMGVEDSPSALHASSVFMEPNMPNLGWAAW